MVGVTGILVPLLLFVCVCGGGGVAAEEFTEETNLSWDLTGGEDADL